MKAQRIKIEGSEGEPAYSWIVVDNEFLPFQPVNEYLKYLENCSCSPNTIRSYAFHLAAYFNFLKEKGLNWQQVNFKALVDLIVWLRTTKNTTVPKTDNVVTFPVKTDKPVRSDKTINTMMAAVISYYDFHTTRGTVEPIFISTRENYHKRGRYKSFLHGIVRQNRREERSVLKLKTIKRKPKTITDQEFKDFVGGCRHVRDAFLVSLLFESGMRIGQALNLRHGDIRSFDNEIVIVPRRNNVNQARTKCSETYTVAVSKELMALYTTYLLEEYADIESDYVFVNLWEKPLGRPMKYNAVVNLFRRLSLKSGVKVHPHMLRHTHATDLIRHGWQTAYVAKRLGHRSVQTTLDIYTHITDEDMKRIHQQYLEESKAK